MFSSSYPQVSTDDQGVDVDDLEKKVAEHKKSSTYQVTDRHPFWAVCYLQQSSVIMFASGWVLFIQLNGKFK